MRGRSATSDQEPDWQRWLEGAGRVLRCPMGCGQILYAFRAHSTTLACNARISGEETVERTSIRLFLANRIMKAADRGERDPRKLKLIAMGAIEA